MESPFFIEPGQTRIQIDETFINWGPFFFQDKPPRIGRVEVEQWTGGISSNTRYFKEVFEIEFTILNQQQANTLTQILQETGVEAVHTLIYQTPEITRKWDGTTAAGSNINTDVNRVREQVLLTYDGMIHIVGNANLYTCVVHGMEI